MRQLVFSKEAGADIKAAYRWYEAQQPGLGREFRLAVEAATSRMQRSPERFRVVSEPFRRALVRRFPFEIFFEADDERVVIYLVFHTSQDPGKWRERLGLP
jgi:plasmid stabilization system protein ParE